MSEYLVLTWWNCLVGLVTQFYWRNYWHRLWDFEVMHQSQFALCISFWRSKNELSTVSTTKPVTCHDFMPWQNLESQAKYTFPSTVCLGMVFHHSTSKVTNASIYINYFSTEIHLFLSAYSVLKKISTRDCMVARVAIMQLRGNTGWVHESCIIVQFFPPLHTWSGDLGTNFPSADCEMKAAEKPLSSTELAQQLR